MQKIDEAIVLAGGLGTRLQGVVNDLPKCMAPVAGRPFLEYVLDYLTAEGIRHTILSVGYLKEKIINHFGIEYKGMALDYAVESEPLGTGGAVKFACNFLHEDYSFILNGDTFFEVSLSDLSRQFMTDKADIALVLKTVPDAGRYGNVVLNSQNRITGFLEKTANSNPGLINGGIYLIDRKCLKNANLPEKFSLEKDFFEKNLESLYLTGFESNAFFIDIGIPEDYDKAQRLFSTT
jgi:D-glycero-alpha-D-manno-heptose 1-phosphate guanylyltransferase